MEKTNKKAPNTATKEPRNFLAAFLLVTTLGQMGINRLYTGETTLGWVRFGLFVGGLILSPVFVGVPLMLAAHVWGIVDVFLVYLGDRTDADGVPMAQTERDRKFARILYIIFIIAIALIVFLFTILLIAFIVTIMQGGTPTHYPSDFREPVSDPFFY